MNTERLLKLADLLEADANNEKGVSFDLGAWIQKRNPSGEFTTSGFVYGEVVPVNCNTAACAWGLAAISGAFADDGVSYTIDGYDRLIPTFLDKRYFVAAAYFFEISESESGFLFDPDFYPESKLRGRDGELFVAARIRELAAGKVTEDDIEDANFCAE